MRFLRYPDLRTMKGIPFTRMHLDRLERDGKFPRRVHLGAATVAWVEDEIDAYVRERIEARDSKAAA